MGTGCRLLTVPRFLRLTRSRRKADGTTKLQARKVPHGRAQGRPTWREDHRESLSHRELPAREPREVLRFDSRTPTAPPIIPGVTDTGEAPPNPLEFLSKAFAAQPHLAEQKVQQAITLLRSAARDNPAYEQAVGDALRSLLAGPQGGSGNGNGAGQSGMITGPVAPTELSPMLRNP